MIYIDIYIYGSGDSEPESENPLLILKLVTMTQSAQTTFLPITLR